MEFDKWEIETVGVAKIESQHVGERNISFVQDDEYIILDNVIDAGSKKVTLLQRAGVRERIFYDASKTRAGIVTCGGLCPGLNSVIRALVMGLWYGYGVKKIIGFPYGYQGLNKDVTPVSKLVEMTPGAVSNIHKLGGTFLGTSRGPQEVSKMVDYLVELNVSILFCIGGDGTLRGANAISQEALSRSLQLSVIGIPKTIDNDIAYIDRSFGFQTAVEKAQQAINAAHCEAHGHENGVAIVKLMGRDSGFIALYASLASGDVNCVLLPEVPVDLESLIEWTQTRLDERSHAVIVVAEGACQDTFLSDTEKQQKDASGNVLHCDVGPRLKQVLSKRLRNPTIKYIDPSYTIRAVAANASDQVFCVTLAQMSVHAGMAGLTSVCVAHAAGHFCLIPLEKLASAPRKMVGIGSSAYQTLLDSTGMPRDWYMNAPTPPTTQKKINN